MPKSGHFAKLTPFPFFPQLLTPRNQTNKLCSPPNQTPSPLLYGAPFNHPSPSHSAQILAPASVVICTLGKINPPTSTCCPGYFSPGARDKQVFLPSWNTGSCFVPRQQGGALHPFKAQAVDGGGFHPLMCGCSSQDASQHVQEQVRGDQRSPGAVSAGGALPFN